MESVKSNQKTDSTNFLALSSNVCPAFIAVNHSALDALNFALITLTMASFEPVRLAYTKYEPDSGADEKLSPIIYLHGLSAAKESWFDIPQTIADATKRRSYAVDARNHGDSEWSDLFNFDANSDDLIHLLDTLKIKRAVIVGHSMGGITAIRTALKRPDRIESIVVEDMFVRKLPKAMFELILSSFGVLKEVLKKIPVDVNEETARKMVIKQFLDNVPPQLAEHIGKSGRNPEVEMNFPFLKRDVDLHFIPRCNIKAFEKAVVDPDAMASEPEGVFDGPALFVYGKLSPMKVGDDEQHIRQFFPNAVFEGLDSDHAVHLYKKAEFVEALLEFLLKTLS